MGSDAGYSIPWQRCPLPGELSAFLSGRLSESDLEGIAQHLDQCARCQAALARLDEHLLPPAVRDVLCEVPAPSDPECERMEAAARLQAPDLPYTLPPGQLRVPPVSGYQIHAWIGHGPHGTVYRASSAASQQPVILKILTAAPALFVGRRRRFHQEAAQAAHVTQGRVIAVLEMPQTDGQAVLVTPFAGNTNLGQIISARRAVHRGQPADGFTLWGGLSDRDYLARILPFLDPVVEALARLHIGGFLYPELKPSNCLLGPQAEARLTDFGLGALCGDWGGLRLLDPAERAGGRMPLPQVINPGFISPEEWAGRRDLDPRADVFRLGVLIYAALTLKLPYGIAPLRRDQRAPVPPSQVQPLLPPAYDAVLLRALTPDRDQRYSTAADFLDPWEAVRHRAGIDPRPTRQSFPVSPESDRPR